MNTSTHYDVAIIGAGMAGLAAGIRLAHFGRRVCIFERHNVVGGLNSFYSLAGRKYDVGLHALTNWVPPGAKGTPLGKLLRQLRIEREEFALHPQKRSRIAFGPEGECGLVFTNDFAVLEAELARCFPAQIDGFRALVRQVRTHDDVSLDARPASARECVRRHLSDPLLEDMLFCPVMYYGSATEQDMDFGQFVIMFKALYLEGFARPLEGVRLILRVLLEKYRQAGGERRMKCGVRRIVAEAGRAERLLLDDGSEITATQVISTAGAAETERLMGKVGEPVPSPCAHPVGRLSYAETITVLDRPPEALGWGDDTIIFFNDSGHFTYEQARVPVDVRSGVLCLPNNFAYPPGGGLPEGLLRCTCLANPDHWMTRPDEAVYQTEKRQWYEKIQTSALRFLPPACGPAGLSVNAAATRADSLEVLRRATVATDMFTPRTITKFTGHLGGAIYGSPVKIRDGRTPLANVYLAGTDQGFLGIVGAMLSGISMANFHVLAGART